MKFEAATASQWPSTIAGLGPIIYYISAGSYTVFILFYVVYYQFIVMKGKMYPDRYNANAGYNLHVITGCIYFIAGILQFSNFIRQRYPRVHRCLGYLYYGMVPITSIGVVWVCFQAHAGSSARVGAATMLPIWITLNIMSYRAIVCFRDVDLHRQLNIAGLALASSIVAMRPLVGMLVVMDGYYKLGPQLSVALWIGFSWFSIGTIAYIMFAYRIPSAQRPRLLHSGAVVLGCQLQPPAVSFVPAEIHSIQRLDAHTIVMRLKPRNDEFQFYYSPGCHIVVRLGDVSREFTPVNYLEDGSEDVDQDAIEIVVRIVPGGRFALAIDALLHKLVHQDDGGNISNDDNDSEGNGGGGNGLNRGSAWHSVGNLTTEVGGGAGEDSNVNQEQNRNGTAAPHFMTCEIYGPLYPIPWRFGYLARRDPDTQTTSASPRASPSGTNIMMTTRSGSVLPEAYKQSTVRTLIMIGAGTGVTAFLSTIHAALLNRSDCTKLRLLFLAGKKSGASCKQYFEDKITTLQKLSRRQQQLQFDGSRTHALTHAQMRSHAGSTITTPSDERALKRAKFTRSESSAARQASGKSNASSKTSTFMASLFGRRKKKSSEAEHASSIDNTGSGSSVVSSSESIVSSPTSAGTGNGASLGAYEEYVRHHSLRFQSITSYERFQPSMVAPWIEEECSNGVAVWICGPPGQGEFVRNQLLAVEDPSLKLTKNQIFVLGVDDR
jgi:NAD(P)H-flavin reductase